MHRWLYAAVALLALGLTGCFVATPPPPPAYANYVPDVSGTWTTRWGSNVATLWLQQNGADVQGSYTTTGAAPGNVRGQMQGSVMVGQWSDGAGNVGGFRFVFDGSGRAFRGTWGHGGSVDDGGNWDGQH